MDGSFYLVGVDMGSTGLKAVALLDGQVAAAAHAPMVYHQEGPVCEYDAEKYYQTVAGLIRQVTRAMPAQAVCRGVAAVCASGNAVLLKAGKPLSPILSWRDNRGAAEMEQVFGPLTEEEVHRTVGWHKVPKFPLAQLSWLKCRRPELWARADLICEGSCYVNYRLCGQFAMDHSTATTFYLQDQQTLTWNPDFLEKLGLPPRNLPRLVAPGTQIGRITPEAARDTGLPAGTPVAAGCYDGAAAARSAGLFREGQMLLSCGTSWVCAYPSKSRRQLLDAGLMIDPYLSEQGLWLGMTSLGECSVYVDQALDLVLPRDGDRTAAFNRLAAAAPPGAGGLLLDPMRLSACDLSGRSGAQICRGIMEGIAYSVKRQIAAVRQKCGGLSLTRAAMVGGPSNSVLWPQIVSDILEVPVHVALRSDACAVGAALLAGLGGGVWDSLAEGQSALREEGRDYLPDTAAAAVYRRAFRDYEAAFPGPEENMH
ncbi:xylulokinase [Intestinimonas massiliensis (ex Afouda et al. 2020)]|uniref:xylulokinase n=1 Tax=Intestinimonas massiliensis (ex Afouda et al. 2020) TaxID=1673721 RepID=UPI00102F3948|nr:FGGY-family carbohydrate kinase [Intestinimonas massiliensis (ex Afouda et al. 2020)]